MKATIVKLTPELKKVEGIQTKIDDMNEKLKNCPLHDDMITKLDNSV